MLAQGITNNDGVVEVEAELPPVGGMAAVIVAATTSSAAPRWSSLP